MIKKLATNMGIYLNTYLVCKPELVFQVQNSRNICYGTGRVTAETITGFYKWPDSTLDFAAKLSTPSLHLDIYFSKIKI